MTLQEIFATIDLEAQARKQVAEQDFNQGQKDCLKGKYNEWYHIHAFDYGRAYDAGWKRNQLY